MNTDKNHTKNTRSRKYMLTLNNPSEHGETHATIKEKLCKYQMEYLAMCDETGSQGTYHIHIYVKFRNAIQFLTIKKMFPSANIATALGTSVQNRNYILKCTPEHHKKDDGTYNYKDSAGKIHSGVNHTKTFEEIGECPQEEQGSRNDLKYMYTLIKDGLSDAEILNLIPETAIKHIDKINKIRHAYLIDKFKGQRRMDLKVHYITGKTGMGKTRDILDEYGDENVYRVTDYHHPFDSYQCEPVICFDEYRSSLKLSDTLNYLDIYPVTLPARYSPKVACYTTVFVVSNWTFEMQYAELQKDMEQKASYDAWVRRFNGYVKEYTDDGIITYPTMQDYLHRHETFHSVAYETVPFDAESGRVTLSDIDADDEMPFH